MNLFEKLPDNFFSILSSKNKNIYGEALITLYDALTMYRSRIRKNDYLDLLKSRSGDDVCKLTFDDEDELSFENIEPSLANKANFILKRLIETGWVYIDYDAKNNVEYLLKMNQAHSNKEPSAPGVFAASAIIVFIYI